MKIDETTKGLLWVALGVLFLLLYTIPVWLFGLGSPLMFFGGTQLRAFIPALVVCLVAADMLRGLGREEDPSEDEEENEFDDIAMPKEGSAPSESAAVAPALPQEAPVRTDGGAAAEDEPDEADVAADMDELRGVLPQPSFGGGAFSPAIDGKTLFELARSISHQEVPDFNHDSEYLELLGDSAAAGYAPAMAKFGEYAIRRRAWVEAYYWMRMARRCGMRGLSLTLRSIRMNWALDGFPAQKSKTSRFYSAQAGSLGRALLHYDSGQEASSARAFLRENYPSFLKQRQTSD